MNRQTVLTDDGEDRVFVVEQALMRSDDPNYPDPENWDYIKLYNKEAAGTGLSRYMSRKTLIEIRDAINDYLRAEEDDSAEGNEVTEKSTEPEIELRFS